MSINLLNSSDEDIISVTGLSRSSVNYFIDEREKVVNGMVGRPPVLSPADEVLVLLLYLRHHLLDILMSFLFQIERKTIYNTRNRMIDFFYNLLKHRISLQTIEWRMDHSVKYYNDIFTFILDGTE